MMDKAAAIKFLQRIAGAIVDTCREAGPLGAPESMIHLALQQQGATPDVCRQIIGALTACGKLRRSGDCLLAV